MSVPAIVLAAGASRRLGQAKQLVLYRGEALLSHAIRMADSAGATPVFVVLGAHFEEISTSISFAEVRVVRNENWQHGLSTSLRAGLRALEAEAAGTEGALILACDQPHLTSEHLRALIVAFHAEHSAVIAASLYAGVRGIPAVFPRTVFADLHRIEGDKGARSLLNDPPCPIVAIDFPDGETDIDYPADLINLE